METSMANGPAGAQMKSMETGAARVGQKITGFATVKSGLAGVMIQTTNARASAL